MDHGIVSARTEIIDLGLIDVVDCIDGGEDSAPAVVEHLVRSLQNGGVIINMITVVPNGDRYRLVAGRGRRAALMRQGVAEAEVRILTGADEAMEARLRREENLFRKRITDADEQISQLLQDYEREQKTEHGGDRRSAKARETTGRTASATARVARSTGRSQTSVRRSMALAAAAPEVMEAVKAKRLGRTKAAQIAAQVPIADQPEAVAKAIAERKATKQRSAGNLTPVEQAILLMLKALAVLGGDQVSAEPAAKQRLVKAATDVYRLALELPENDNGAGQPAGFADAVVAAAAAAE